jgi:carbonic anhydrase
MLLPEKTPGLMTTKILKESKALKKMAEHGELKVMGGYYSLETGKVELRA